MIQGHPLAYWDDLPSCRTCLHGVGIFCTRQTPCNTCKGWTDDMWAAFEDAEIRSAHKREKHRLIRVAKEAVASSSHAPSPEILSADTLMPPPPDPPRRVLKSSSTGRCNASMGADADWSPLESHPSGGTPAQPQVSQTIVGPPTRYRDAVLRFPRSTTVVRISGMPPTGWPFRSSAYRFAGYRVARYWTRPGKVFYREVQEYEHS